MRDRESESDEIDELADGSEALMRMLDELPRDRREAVRARLLEERLGHRRG